MTLDYQRILCQTSKKHHHLHLSGVFPTLRNADASHAPSVCAGISTEEGFPKRAFCWPCRGAEDAGCKTGRWPNTSTSSARPASLKQGYMLVSCLLSLSKALTLL